MTVIARYFESAQQARNARQSLENEGIPPRIMALVEAPGEGAEGPAGLTADVDAAMKAGRLLGENASFYSSNMKPGQALLVVEAPFGLTVTVLNVMEANGALDISHEPPAEVRAAFVPLSRRPAPLSSLFGWPVLSRTPETYSQFWGFPELSRRLSFLGRWFPTLARPNFVMLPSLFGLGLLSRNPAPLSSMFGLPLKSGESGDAWTSSLGFPMLTSSGPTLAAIPQLSRRRWLY